MAEIYRFNADIGELAAVTYGFDYKWDQSVERKHIKKETFNKQIRLALKELREQYKNIDPLELMFPDLATLGKMVDDFLKDMAKTLQPPKR